MNIKMLWNDISGVGKTIHGRFTVDDWTEETYEDFYDYLLDQLSIYIGDDYDSWYKRVALSYYRHRVASAVHNIMYIPQYDKPLEEQTTREQLVTLRYFIYRRATSAYAAKCEEER
ncbi:hypothetical protein LLE49_19955 [Alicyclobacillus tolerans]|uniref:hypothetical protein n=1 Tax=Alicyclobacillus tolerans TaxID=90970 RepID=UPI001F4142CF|nr:hypothetical protein [Alicyclobacillus tolerans]MCF8566998.1 hypothetical protein [Alicyclobacillus tolerans]